MLRVTAPQGVSLDYTASKMREIEDRTAALRASGEVVGTFSIAGTSGDNSGFMIFTLAPWGERARDQQAIVADVSRAAAAVVGVRSFAVQPNSLGIRGAGQGLQFALLGSDFDEPRRGAAEALVKAMEADPRFRQVRVSYETTQPQLYISVDRERASDLGIDIDGLGETLQAVLDGRSVGSVFIDDRSYDIDISSTTNPVRDPTDLESLFLAPARARWCRCRRSSPSRSARSRRSSTRESQMRAIPISASLADGVGLADAYDRGGGARRRRCCRPARGSSRWPRPRRSTRPRAASSSPSASRSSSCSSCSRRSSRASPARSSSWRRCPSASAAPSSRWW